MSRRLVEFDYLLKNAAGEVLDNSKEPDGEPMRYVEGSNQIIPGLESRMKPLKKGDKSEITVPAAEAYGAREEKLVIEVPLDQFPANQKVTVGLEVEIEVAEDYFHPFTVTQLGKSHATLDGNHELAGVDLYFSVEVKEAREATAAEIAESESEHDHDHEHGENCNH
jgi:FKBP-type peptidyl-prolyl cis-trans isomerase SlyD